MDTQLEQRKEERLNYNWPVWFAENFDGILSQGQMCDVSSTSASFSCYADQCPFQGQQVTARFSVPKYRKDGMFDLENLLCHGIVERIENINPFMRKVVFQFTEPLNFKPGEQEHDTRSAESKIYAMI